MAIDTTEIDDELEELEKMIEDKEPKDDILKKLSLVRFAIDQLDDEDERDVPGRRDRGGVARTALTSGGK